MKFLKYSVITLLYLAIFFTSCNEEEPCTEITWYQDADGDGLGNPDISLTSCDPIDGYVDNSSDVNDSGVTPTPLSAFDEFNSSSVTISFDGDEITIVSTGIPNHTSCYWEETEDLYIEQNFGDHVTPGKIREGSYTVTVSASPELANQSSATGLGAIGIAVTGAPIYNDQERQNMPLDVETALGFDYAGGHVGPGGYHYHIEAADVAENKTLSYDDESLVGIMADGFLLYGRKEMDGSYPSDLDESGGHFGVTPHSNGEEIYHYHIVNEYYVNSYILLFGGDLKGTPNTIF